MKEYTVLFEFYGKKFKTKILATSSTAAKEVVKSKVIFHQCIAGNNTAKQQEIEDMGDMIYNMVNK